MSGSKGRFKFLKKLYYKFDKLILGDLIESNKDSKKSYRNSKKSLNYERYHENSIGNYKEYSIEDLNTRSIERYNTDSIEKEDNSLEKDYLNNSFENNLNKTNDSNFDEKYSKYIYLDNFKKNRNLDDTNHKNTLNKEEYNHSYLNNSTYYDNGYENNDEYFFSEYDKNNSGGLKRKEKFNFKNFSLKNIKNSLLNSDDSSKRNFGLISIFLIILVLSSSIFYFAFFQPFQEELGTEKTAKLNELNTLYKGPLTLNTHAFNLKNQIQDSFNINDIKSIDILRTATDDWREYHISKINNLEDDYGRVMMSCYDEKKILMSCDDAKVFVNENDAKILSNILFEKVDTVIVPISINRLQATGGLISVGSIVDIYSLSLNKSNYYSSQEEVSNLDNSSLDNSEDDSLNDEKVDNFESSQENIDFKRGHESNLTLSEEPNVSGATVLAILRSKDSGVIDSTVSSSTNLIEGNYTYPNENSNSFSTDVEELLKSSIFNAYDEEALYSYLDSYGIKLSDYERLSNIGELDVEYLVLIEIPRSDVDFVINNMDNLIFTIPTEHAPNWAINELNQTYYDELNSY